MRKEFGARLRKQDERSALALCKATLTPTFKWPRVQTTLGHHKSRGRGRNNSGNGEDEAVVTESLSPFQVQNSISAKNQLQGVNV